MLGIVSSELSLPQTSKWITVKNRSNYSTFTEGKWYVINELVLQSKNILTTDLLQQADIRIRSHDFATACLRQVCCKMSTNLLQVDCRKLLSTGLNMERFFPKLRSIFEQTILRVAFLPRLGIKTIMFRVLQCRSNNKCSSD